MRVAGTHKYPRFAFVTFLVWRSRNNLHKSVALPCDTPPLIPALLPEGEGSF
jgi:hypothetical protein